MLSEGASSSPLLLLLLQVELLLSDGIPFILPPFLLESSRWESSCCCSLPAYSAWPKMAVKDANPSGVLVSIAESSKALKWSAIIFLNLSSLLSPPPNPEPPPPVPAITIRSAQAFLWQFSSNAENEFKFRRRFTLGPQKDFTTLASRDFVSLHLRDFRQFRACDVTRIGTCDTGFIANAMQCCYFRNVGGLRSRGLR